MSLIPVILCGGGAGSRLWPVSRELHPKPFIRPADGQALLHNVADCHIQSNKRIVRAVGVNNLIIVGTPEALRVSGKSQAQDVKYLYAELKSRGHEAHRHHLTVHRPRGTYTVLQEDLCFNDARGSRTSGRFVSNENASRQPGPISKSCAWPHSGLINTRNASPMCD
jgi:hypothetical protein